jgi:hypothetical protein
VFQGQVKLSDAAIGPGDVDLDKEVEAGEPASLAETELGPFGPGDCDPNVALFLGERAPTGGDGAEVLADSDLGRGAGVERDKGPIGYLAIAGPLPYYLSAFARLRKKHFHN